MSQRGRTYRPRQNNNQTKKNEEPEVKKEAEEVKEPPAIEIQPEPTEVTKVNVESQEVPEVRETITTEPQIVKPIVEETNEQWLNKAIDEGSKIEEEMAENNKIIERYEKKQSDNWLTQALNEGNEIAKEIVEKEKVKPKSKKKGEKPHYVFGRDEKDGKIKRMSNQPEVKEVPVNNTKKDMLKILLSENEKAIMKLEIEIEIHEKLQLAEADPKKNELLDRKLINFRTSLDDLNARKKIIANMISEN